MDPFLNLHQVGTLPVFDLASGLTTISIRDQMVRGKMLGDRLPRWLAHYYAEKGLNHLENPVLVVGGGACGITAATLLALAGHNVVVAERESILFNTLANCASRWVDPSQYNWPMDDWRQAQLPSTACPITSWPLPWQAQRASHIVKNQWGGALAQLVRRHGLTARMRSYFSTKVNPKTDWGANGLEVLLTDLKNGEERCQIFSAVVWAIGFGRERCTLKSSPEFRGVSFWTTDAFEQLNSGLARELRDSVVISGTGDGALQDLIRIVTRKKSAREVVESLDLQPIFQQISSQLLILLTREWQHERALNWCTANDRVFAEKHLSNVHNAHEQIVTEVLRIGGPKLESDLNNLTANRPQSTILVTTTPFFSCLYALNRFVALLLIRNQQTGIIVEKMKRVSSVTSKTTPAEITPSACIGHPWDVELEDILNGQRSTVNANVVILRHGLEPHDTTLPAEPARILPRPVPPSHLT